MTPYLFPYYRITLGNGSSFSPAVFAQSALGFSGAYGKSYVFTLAIVGDDAFQVMDEGLIQQGTLIAEIYAGYEDDLKLVGKNLLVWDLAYQGSSEGGDTLTLTAYGVSQLLRQSGNRTEKLAAKTYADAAREVVARWGIPVQIGSGAYTNPVAGSVSAEALKERKAIYQENEDDFSFLRKLGDEIGYVLSETELGDALYFGPGLEVGSRERYILVRGEFQYDGGQIPANIGTIAAQRSLYGVPSEIVVTGFDGDKQFAMLISTDDLAARHKITTVQTTTTGTSTAAPSGDAAAGFIDSSFTGEIASFDTGSPKTTTKKIERDANVGDFAGKLVADLLQGAYPVAKRLILGGSSSQLDARAQALESLALAQLRFQEVLIAMHGIAGIKPGHEILVLGSKIPRDLRGLYLVREVGGNVDSESGFDMQLTLARNTV